MRSVKVQINDDDRAGAIITPTGRTTQVIEGGQTDEYAVMLTRQPDAQVDVMLDAFYGQVALSTDMLTFTDADYNVPQFVTVTALDDDAREGFHTDYLSHTVTSADGGSMPNAVARCREALREVHAADPGILGPIEEAFDVRIDQRLGDDGAWSTLAC